MIKKKITLKKKAKIKTRRSWLRKPIEKIKASEKAYDRKKSKETVLKELSEEQGC